MKKKVNKSRVVKGKKVVKKSKKSTAKRNR